MRITSHIKEVAELKGFTTSYSLWKVLGGSKESAHQLWNGDFKRIDLETVAKLCKLFKCQPGKLFKYEEEEE